jgi:putative oxidoreductase
MPNAKSGQVFELEALYTLRSDSMRDFLKHFYLILISIGKALESPFLLVIRLFWGWAFFKTGLGKLTHIDVIIGYFQTLGVPMPAFSAYSAAIVECFGGALLLLGLGSRLVAIPLMCTMIMAFLTAYPDVVRMIFTNPMSLTLKDPFCFFFVSLIIFIFGPGKISIDYWLKRTYFYPSSLD